MSKKKYNINIQEAKHTKKKKKKKKHRIQMQTYQKRNKRVSKAIIEERYAT
jgi:hypothetical protein